MRRKAILSGLFVGLSSFGTLCVLTGQAPTGPVIPITGSGGGSTSGTLDFQAATTAQTMTGSPVTLWTSASAVTLTAGKCITVQAGALATGAAASQTTLEVYADATLIKTVYTNGTMGQMVNTSYCNLPGSTTAQLQYDYVPLIYGGSGNLTGTANMAFSSAGVFGTPTAVTWGATTHNILLKATAASGTVTGQWFKILNF